ncbi:MAG: tripartite tricarboxylate transporter TctB family protein [Chloroflexi bacterium]|nr:tripartite tricarboxylate transporter TctB family protein [Chloroflexota bacterium]
MKVKMKKADQITAIVLLLFSAFVIAESSKMTLMVEFAPGYGFFPFWLGILMAVLSVMLFVDARRRPEALDESASFPSKPIFLNVLLVLASLGVYAFLMELVGYMVDTLLLAFVLVGLVEKEKWQKALVAAVLMTAGLYVIFQVILGVSLPKNVLGF